MNKKAKCSLKVRGLLCFLSVISLSVNTFARPQEDIRITLELNDISLETAIDNIEEQSSYLFMNSDVDVNQTISLSVTNETIKNVCNALFTPINVDYRIEGHHIYISRKPEPDPVRISGTVLDQTGLPVPGAAVLESGTSNADCRSPGPPFWRAAHPTAPPQTLTDISPSRSAIPKRA